ncbi:MAG TPA: hypothetical protein VHN37_08860 [Actinomycetota bacterium]|nr:hypothetical protein [Actinomycetota bacterium]
MKTFRKPVVAGLSLMLVAGLVIAPATAKPKKKKPKPPPAPVAVDLKYFLASNGCPPTGTTARDADEFLTLTDTEDAIECNHTAAGIRNDIQTMTPQYTREGQSRWWDTIDGVPLVLDTSKRITGEIFTAGTSCAAAGVCSPTPLSAGEQVFEITVIGETGGEEVEIGTYTETFTVGPGVTHAVKVDVAIDQAHAGKVFDSITMITYQRGNSVGHGVIKSNAPTSSYIVVPTLK